MLGKFFKIRKHFIYSLTQHKEKHHEATQFEASFIGAHLPASHLHNVTHVVRIIMRHIVQSGKQSLHRNLETHRGLQTN